VQKSILTDFPDTGVSLSVIWIDMLPTDNAEQAQKMANTIRDPRVRHFHDPRASRLAGRAFARGLLSPAAGPAWDIYMFYEKGQEWRDGPPRPVEWMHQLGGGRRADAARFHTGDDLVLQLHEAMHKVTGAERADP
jgi:hypothetical protein